MTRGLDRRRFLSATAAAAASALLTGCDRVTESDWGKTILGSVDAINRRLQRLFASSTALAREYGEADLSPAFRANGNVDPGTDAYHALAANGFADYRLEVAGLVERPGSFSLADLKALPARTQITRHDCVEGWSCIGKWTGVPLGLVLDKVGVKPGARYVLFRCADAFPGVFGSSEPYYESIDLDDAYHPQTILAYAMNGEPLPVPYGAPLRVRVERQLGYKMAKYVMRIELVDSFAGVGRGKGGYWEDHGYAWYAGI
jgi:DMSO/TMAO reductase YedYZ molybdopterin-dependent catalytic subunit